MKNLMCHLGLLLVLLGWPSQEQALCSSPESGTIIVLNKSEASASLISLKSSQIVATVLTGVGPHEVAVSPDGQIAVVANYGAREPDSTLTVIDLIKRKVIQTIDLEKYQRPHGIVFLKDGKNVLVTAEAQKALLEVDLENGKVVKAIDTGQEVSHMVALLPAGDQAFVANIRSGSVTVIDLQKAEAVAIIQTGAGAEGIDISPDGREVWVSNREDDSISIIDTGSLEVVDKLESKSFPIRVKFTPNGQYALVSNARSGDVAVFDVHQRKEVRRIAMPVRAKQGEEDRLFSDRFGDSPVPVGILIHPNGEQAYVANTNADIVAVIDLNSWQITNSLKAGREPDGLGFSPVELEVQAGK
ncbi:MAG: cytochrome D1 domain-containing protein [bacterium]